MTTIVEVIEGLRGLGVEVIPDPPKIRLRYAGGPQPPAEARPLIEALRGQKTAVLAELTRWDEHQARQRLRAAFDWADAEPGGRGVAWADAWETLPSELKPFMDEALDHIDDAFRHRDPAGLENGLEEFRRIVSIVLDAYQRSRAEDRRVPA